MRVVAISLCIVLSVFVAGCTNPPSTSEIDADIEELNAKITEAADDLSKFDGGALAVLAKLRLETIKSTKDMIEQKKIGINRFIKIAYTVDGEKYSVPENKVELLKGIDEDLKALHIDRDKAEHEALMYGGGLLGALALMNLYTVKNSIAFLDQKRLLLKHDIPSYAILPEKEREDEGKSGFKATPGRDVDKF